MKKTRQWSVADLAEFGRPYEGKTINLHGRVYTIISYTSFSDWCTLEWEESEDSQENRIMTLEEIRKFMEE